MKIFALFSLALLSMPSLAIDLRLYECAGGDIKLNLYRYYTEASDELEIEVGSSKELSLIPKIASRKGRLAVCGFHDEVGRLSFTLVEPNLIVDPDERGIIKHLGYFSTQIFIHKNNSNYSVSLICKVSDYTKWFFMKAR